MKDEFDLYDDDQPPPISWDDKDYSSKKNRKIDAVLSDDTQIDPTKPCFYPPGSPEKVVVMKRRLESGLPLWMAGDAGNPELSRLQAMERNSCED